MFKVFHIIVYNRGSYYMQFPLDHDPKEEEEVSLEMPDDIVQRGVYRLVEIKRPPSSLAAVGFAWEVQLQRVGDLGDKSPILAGFYY